MLQLHGVAGTTVRGHLNHRVWVHQHWFYHKGHHLASTIALKPLLCTTTSHMTLLRQSQHHPKRTQSWIPPSHLAHWYCVSLYSWTSTCGPYWYSVHFHVRSDRRYFNQSAAFWSFFPASKLNRPTTITYNCYSIIHVFIMSSHASTHLVLVLTGLKEGVEITMTWRHDMNAYDVEYTTWVFRWRIKLVKKLMICSLQPMLGQNWSRSFLNQLHEALMFHSCIANV